ncbi:ATP-dependent metalloprotease FtsH [Desulfurobacterium thermolithotrophum DSM 11699]|uniref:ATP-dependent zinc metalloprotease FtsH n=1 Tax=Desulfurobacterium thermolithotrophum (strain DSM 11699 / BSA) TaxID=868864 RepID=F0RZZ6_DESTD|nr:ATP-dependent zinc metalloprotease FtsH [Desulfurobacterium thermolithotrophum]ADY73677.1 ATP-dependent metalloprotease FtsH [Desulfurobacterium thermolithotrophum DSM 11699]
MDKLKEIGKSLALWLTIALLIILAFNFFNSEQLKKHTEPFSTFLQQVEKGEVKKVVIQGQKVTGVTKDNKPFETYLPPGYTSVIDKLAEKNVEIQVKPEEGSPWYITVLVSWLPMIFLILLWISMMRQMSMGSNKALSFAKSRAKVFIDNKPKVTFKDVAGIDEVKEEVSEIVDFLKNPKKFQQLGGRIPKGVLLAGAPGTGKTLLAKAIAGEANVPFLSVSGSEFVEMFVGVGASRVRDLFEQAKRHAPCIVFIDEIDAVGRKRGAGFTGGHDEREQTLNQLLVEMDGFESSEGIIVIAATNRPDILDPALLRPGRFDRQIHVPLPDVRGRLEILKIHTKDKPLAEDVDLEVIARSTPGFSGADLANIVNEAALIAARKNHGKITMEDFEEAKDKVTMGIERKSMVLSEEEKVTTAYHEAGHTLIAKLLPNADKVHKVTIIPRGKALGITQQLPEEDRYTYTKDYLLDRLCVLFGGRVAEELALGTISTGAGNDIERATEIAKKMVAEWGMSDTIGPIAVKIREQFGEPAELISEEMKKLIDKEVRKIIQETYERTKELISQNMDKLENLAKALLERETLTGEEIDMAMKGELKSNDMDSTNPPAGSKKERKEEIPPSLNPQLEA